MSSPSIAAPGPSSSPILCLSKPGLLVKLISLLILASSLAASAQTNFHAFESTETLIEGGTVQTLVVDTGREHLVTRLPRGFSAAVTYDTQSVLFKEDTGRIAITMCVTTNSPGRLPADDTLRSNALAANPGAAFLQISSCATGYRPARFIDSTVSLDPVRNIRTRHAFVPCPEGVVEFVISAKEQDFNNKGRVVFNLFLSSFRVETIESQVKPPR
jgi:hypothetical protein